MPHIKGHYDQSHESINPTGTGLWSRISTTSSLIGAS